MIFNTVELMAPILLAAIGGLFAERAGVLNIALEGLILVGAFAAISLGAVTGSVTLAFAAAAGASVMLASIFAFAALRLRANIFVAGLATNLFAAGLIPFISNALYSTKGVVRLSGVPAVPRLMPALRSLPVIGPVFFAHTISVYLALATTVVAAVVLAKTRFGLRISAAGLNAEGLRARGCRPEQYQAIAILVSGALSGLAGAAIVLRLGVYLPNISAGRGWIALVAIFLGYRKPFGVLIAAFVFALSESLAVAAQGQLQIPGTVLLALPYLLTVVAMIGYSIFRAMHRARRA